MEQAECGTGGEKMQKHKEEGRRQDDCILEILHRYKPEGCQSVECSTTW